MMNIKTNTLTREYEMPYLTVKAKTAATLIAIVTAVILPQMLHTIGAITGMGSMLGEIFLPMYLPIIILGLIAGSYAGIAAGVGAPIISFYLTGMPGMMMLPFITIELMVYGVCSGMLGNVKIPTLGKVLISQMAGRVIRIVAMLLSLYILGNSILSLDVIRTSITAGIVGIALQWVIVPGVVSLVRRAIENEARFE